MQDKAQDDDLVMKLVDLALAQPSEQRQAYLQSACSGDPDLYRQVMNYVQWDDKMGGFLLDPLYPLALYEHPFEPGDLLDGRFRIVREVAQGGMGIVYEATDEKLHRRIALKCAKAGFRKRLPPEVRLATEISHPNVCKTYEIHSTTSRQGDVDFLTMEFLDGETLFERLRRGPIPEKQARSIALQLCAGLAEAHRNHVIHGDLKSGNVILTRTPAGEMRAVITDFGLARGSDAPQRTVQSGERGGTPNYMAPELWRGEKASVASDIFALGVMLYELLSGRCPFESEEGEPAASWELKFSRKPAPVHPKWDRILARCLDPNPTHRFHGADEIARALTPSPTRRTVLWAAAAAALLAVASVAATYFGVTKPPESVRLAVLPFQANGDASAFSRGVWWEAVNRMAGLKGNARTRFSLIPLTEVQRRKVDTVGRARSELDATHVLRGSLAEENGRVTLRAFLTDARTQVNSKEWKADYAPTELRYIPTALAGLVTLSLKLPPPIMSATISAPARQDYLAGMTYLRRDAGVDAALSAFEHAAAADPDSPLGYAGLAEAQWFKYFLSKDRQWLDRSTQSFREAERRNPDLAPVHRVGGMLQAEAGLYELATAEYRRAIELEPAGSENYRRLGLVSELTNRLDDALIAFQKGIELQPDDFRLRQDLGGFHDRSADHNEAINHLRAAVELAPDDPNVHRAVAVALVNAGRFSEAEQELRVSLGLREIPAALNSLGLALMYQGRDREAVPYFTRAVSLDPQRYLSWMDLGIAYRRLGLAADAELANRRGLERAELEMAKNPRNGYVRSILAFLCARLGDRPRAESEIAQALQLSPNLADTRWMAALTYETLGNREATLSVLSPSPAQLIEDLSRWPDVADLHKDSRFKQLLAIHQVK